MQSLPRNHFLFRPPKTVSSLRCWLFACLFPASRLLVVNLLPHHTTEWHERPLPQKRAPSQLHNIRQCTTTFNQDNHFYLFCIRLAMRTRTLACCSRLQSSLVVWIVFCMCTLVSSWIVIVATALWSKMLSKRQHQQRCHQSSLKFKCTACLRL